MRQAAIQERSGRYEAAVETYRAVVDRSPRQRPAATEALLRIDPRHPAAVRAHGLLLVFGRPDQKLQSAVALRVFGESAVGAIDGLLYLLGDDAPEAAMVRNEAITTLGILGPAAEHFDRAFAGIRAMARERIGPPWASVSSGDFDASVGALA